MAGPVPQEISEQRFKGTPGAGGLAVGSNTFNDVVQPAGNHASQRAHGAGAESKPSVKGKLLGVWKETWTSARLKGGEEIKRPGKTTDESEGGFATFQEALVYAGAAIASSKADGGVIIKESDRFYAFSIVSDAWINEFSRKNVEEGFDQVLISESEVDGIEAFVTEDGYAVPWTMSPSPSPSIPVHIVERGWQGGYWHSTKTPEAEGFQTILKEVKEAGAAEINEQGYVRLFKGLLKANALVQLEKNKKRLGEEEQKYFSGEQAKVQLAYLRKIISKDKEFARYQKEVTARMADAQVQSHRADDSAILLGNLGKYRAQLEYAEKMRVLNPLFEEIKESRYALRTEYPALAALGYKDIAEDIPDDKLTEKISAGFVDIRAAIEDIFNRVHEEDIPLTKLGPIVEQTKKEMGLSEKKTDPMSKAILDWLEKQDTKELIYSLSGTLSSVALGVGAFFASGGTALLLGIGGAAIGFGTAAYEFKISEGVNRAAQTEVAGGKLVEDAQAAHFQYIMGWVNLVLAGLDIALSVKAGSALVKSGRLTKKLAGAPGADVLAELKPEQIIKFDRALQLKEAGKAVEAEALLNKLRTELGDDVFLRSESLFRNAGKAKTVSKVGPPEVKAPVETTPSVGENPPKRPQSIDEMIAEELAGYKEPNLEDSALPMTQAKPQLPPISYDEFMEEVRKVDLAALGKDKALKKRMDALWTNYDKLVQGKSRRLFRKKSDYIKWRYGKDYGSLPENWLERFLASRGAAAHPGAEAGRVAERIWGDMLVKTNKNKRLIPVEEFIDPITKEKISVNVEPDFMPSAQVDETGKFVSAEQVEDAVVIADSKYKWGDKGKGKVRFDDRNQIKGMLALAKQKGKPFVFLVKEGGDVAPEIRKWAKEFGLVEEVDWFVRSDISSKIK